MNNSIYEVNDFELDNDALKLAETIFHNTNGYLGVRSNFEEGYPSNLTSIRGTYINGFYDFTEMKQAEKLYELVEEKQTMLNVVDTQSIRLFIGDEECSMFSGHILKSKRLLNMQKGISMRLVRWRSAKGREVEIKIIRMASFARLCLFTIDYQVTLLNCDAQVWFISSHLGEVRNYSDPEDPRLAAEAQQHIFIEDVSVLNNISYITARTAKSGLFVCSGVKNVISSASTMVVTKDQSTVAVEFQCDGRQNQSIQLVKYSTLADSIRFSDPKAECKKHLSEALSATLQTLYDEQEQYLAETWANCELEIEGDDELNLALKYNIYQLIQSVTKDEFGNIAA